MTTVVDSNVLIAFWKGGERVAAELQEALDAALSGGPLVCPAPVYAELIALPTRTEGFLDEFFHDSGITLDWHLSEQVWRAAGAAYQGYARRRRKQHGGEPRRILTDFLIGAYASVHRARLLTLDQRLYRAAFPKLALIKA